MRSVVVESQLEAELVGVELGERVTQGGRAEGAVVRELVQSRAHAPRSREPQLEQVVRAAPSARRRAVPSTAAPTRSTKLCGNALAVACGERTRAEGGCRGARAARRRGACCSSWSDPLASSPRRVRAAHHPRQGEALQHEAATATRKATKTSSGRSTVSRGRVCAAASVTTPRMPAQTMTCRASSRAARPGSSRCRRTARMHVAPARHAPMRRRGAGCRRLPRPTRAARASLAANSVDARSPKPSSAFRGRSARAPVATLHPHEHRDVDRAHDQDDRRVPPRPARPRARAPRGPSMFALDDVLQLEAHQQEDAALEHEFDRAPVEVVRQPLFGCEPACRPLPGHDARDDGSDQPRSAELLGGQVGHERARRNSARCWPPNAPPRARTRRLTQPTTAPITIAMTTPQTNAPTACPEREAAPATNAATAVRRMHERGRVVEQALALEHRHDAARDAEALHDRGGDRIGGAQDGAERDARAEAAGRGWPATKKSAEHDRADHHEQHRRARRSGRKSRRNSIAGSDTAAE